jgi:hypothetical protein
MGKPGWHRRPRREPYTAAGISRVPCVRCGRPADHQWQVCADDRAFRAICTPCDVALNEAVLTFLRHPNVPAAMKRYRKRLVGG